MYWGYDEIQANTHRVIKFSDGYSYHYRSLGRKLSMDRECFEVWEHGKEPTGANIFYTAELLASYFNSNGADLT